MKSECKIQFIVYFLISINETNFDNMSPLFDLVDLLQNFYLEIKAALPE